MTSIFDNDYFKNYTPSPELMQQVRDDSRFPEFKSWAEGWLEKTGAPFLAPAVPPAIAPEAVKAELKAAEEIEKIFQDSANICQEYGKKTGLEMAHLVDNKTGEILFDLKGSANNVELSYAISKLKTNSDITIIHNHPGSASFSGANIGILSNKNLNRIIAKGHDGTFYELSFKEDIWKRQIKMTDPNSLIRIWGDYERKIMPKYIEMRKKRTIFDIYGGGIVDKKADQLLWKQHTHEIMETMAKDYGLEYKRILP